MILSACGDKGANDGFVAKLVFDVPDTASEDEAASHSGFLPLTLSPMELLLETPTTSSNILARWGRRTELAVERINAVIDRLNDRVGSTGSFSVEGDGGVTIAGVVRDIETGDYVREAVLCKNGAPYLHVQWTFARETVRAVRDFGVTPLTAVPGTEMRSELTLTTATDGTKTLTVVTNGIPYFTPLDVKAEVANPAYLAEWAELKVDAAGVFTMRGVNDWSAVAPTASSQYVGDAYLSGKLGADGAGTYVASRVYTDSCESKFPFNESAPVNSYCFTGTIAGAGAASHAVFDPAHWTEELRAVGAARASDVRFVQFDTGLSCE